jgi:hypothetical protein
MIATDVPAASSWVKKASGGSDMWKCYVELGGDVVAVLKVCCNAVNSLAVPIPARQAGLSV